MQYIRIVALFLFLILLISLFACSKSPEAARKELGQMNIDYTDDSFFMYVRRGDKVIVDLFITAGKSPNFREDESGSAILAVAAHDGHDEIVKLLIAKGADVNAAVTDGEFRGETPLTLAVDKKKEYRNPELVEAMLSKGSANDKNMSLALLIAKELSYTEAVDILKKAGAKELNQ